MDTVALHNFAPKRRDRSGGVTVRERHVSTYQDLTQKIRDAGLMKRRYGFYWSMMIGALLVLVALAASVVLIGESWFQLIPAAVLGVVMAQLGFIGHEAAHRQVFTSPRWNEWTSRVLSGVTGLSYGWWMNKHNRHHANPNREGKDPDIDSGVLVLSPEAADTRSGLASWLAARQGYFFLPILFLEGLSLHVAAGKMLLTSPGVKHRRFELAFYTIRNAGLVAALFLLLSPGLAIAFLAVQLGVFGFLLGAAFAPNHIGMPTVPREVNVDFLRRQVLMSRNIRGGPVVRFFMGGLDNQIEHHLFPMVARPNLRKAQAIVREHCAQQGIAYTETTVWQAFAVILRYLNQVGLKNRDAFSCPLVQQYRG